MPKLRPAADVSPALLRRDRNISQVGLPLNKTCPVRFLCSAASPDTTALYSEITMYVLLVFLTCWLLVEMVYCYRKISRSDEQMPDAA